MFWGLVLEPGKRYSTTVEKSFHVSMGALDCSSIKNDNEVLSVILETEGSESLLCNLCKQKGILQSNLDLNFMAGDRLTFECRGHGRIHLSGYLLPDEDDDMSNMIEDEESEDEDNDAPVLMPGFDKPKKDKRKIEAPPAGGNLPKKKKIEAEDAEDSDSEEDDDSDLSEGGDEQEDEDVEEEEEEDDESDDDEEIDNVPTPPKKEHQKTPNKQQQTPKTPVTNGVSPKEQKSNKKTPGGGEKNTNASPKQRIALEKGVIVKELRVGNGAPAKSGKMVAVTYIGRLKDGKVFDKTSKGAEFKFRLGKGEVIKGWDIGVQGMRVGGRRTITCPPEVAYGPKGAAPKIPPNSTLNFEVELKNVF